MTGIYINPHEKAFYKGDLWALFHFCNLCNFDTFKVTQEVIVLVAHPGNQLSSNVEVHVSAATNLLNCALVNNQHYKAFLSFFFMKQQI